MRAHTRLRFKERAPADDGAKECHPFAPVDKDKDGGVETDPYAGLWPWGDYFPDDAELRREDFFTVQEQFWRQSNKAAAALKDMVAGVFRPLLDNFHHHRSLKTLYDTEDYHIGMPLGIFQVHQRDPNY